MDFVICQKLVPTRQPTPECRPIPTTETRYPHEFENPAVCRPTTIVLSCLEYLRNASSAVRNNTYGVSYDMMPPSVAVSVTTRTAAY